MEGNEEGKEYENKYFCKVKENEQKKKRNKETEIQ